MLFLNSNNDEAKKSKKQTKNETLPEESADLTCVSYVKTSR